MNTDNPEDIIHFEEFTRKGTSVLICLFGFSGCGKTLSAINIAKGIGGKTFFLDTETGRGRVYAEDAKGFTYGELTPPFTPERYVSALRQIQRGGFDNLIIDSGSHEWDGLGGMLEIADGNKISGLGKWSVKSRHKTFMGTLMASRMNIIICLRAKDKYVQEGRGKDAEIHTDGFVAIQERNFKYDMMIQLPMPEDGQGRYSMDRKAGFKCPRDLLPAFEEGKQINFDVGVKIAEWIKTGQPMDEVARQLKFDAQEHADAGVDNFRQYYATLSKDHQQKLRPFLNNFQNAAKAVDRERAAQIAAAEAVISEGGSDISSLMSNAPQSKFEPSKNTLLVRRDEDSDWWAIIDDLIPMVRACKSVSDFLGFFVDHDKNLRAIDKMAPDDVSAYLNQIIQEVQKGFKKAA
jgi:hypothetical protein